MRLISSFASTLALVAGGQFVLAGCGRHAEAMDVVLPLPAVSVAPAVQCNLSDREEFSGRLEAIEFVALRPRVVGSIGKVHFTDGALVRKEDLLFTIDPRPFEAEVARAQAQVAAAQARSQLVLLELDRASTLLASQVSSKQEVEELTSGSRTALADHQGAAAALRIARLNLGCTRVRAPISGCISNAAVSMLQSTRCLCLEGLATFFSRSDLE